MHKDENKTLVIDNFKGSMSTYLYGDVNSGLTNVVQSYGHDPFSKPGRLTWAESAVQIDPAGSIITGLVLAGKVRVESGITYVYCIDHTARLYKIQVNDPTTYNSDYDNPALITTLTMESPTFTRGGFIDFFGATQQIYIGHDKGVTKINFDGTGETFVGTLLSWTQTVPRPFVQFIGKLYIGNGSNIAEIDSTGTVTTYSKLTPAFPLNTQVRDLDVTPNGNYLQAAVTELALSDITATTPDTSIIGPANSYTFIWNGIDLGYTSVTFYPSTVVSAASMFGSHQYVFGYDFIGGAIYNPIEKFLTSLPSSAYGESPFPNAVISTSNTMTWITTLPFEGVLALVYCVYGTISDLEVDPGFWSPLSPFATAPETDIVHVPCQIAVSNFAQGTSQNGYTDNIFGTAKIYFSTLETSPTPSTAYRLYRWCPSPVGLGTTEVGALYQTQSQVFSKKIKVSEVRVYGEPWQTDNSFTIDLIGSDQNIIPGGSKTFTAGSNLSIGQDFCWYNPEISPTYVLAIRVTNEGESNHTINKIEIDYSEAGK